MTFKVTEIEPTPNPDAKKFMLDRSISENSLSFRSPEEAAGHPMAEQLLGINGVISVLMLQDFVTINKSSESRWADITAKVKKVLAKAPPPPPDEPDLNDPQ